MADDKRIASVPRRGLPRFALVLDAWLRDGANLVAVKLSDLSCDGCRVEGAIYLEQATEVWLKVAGLTPRAARVAWSRKGRAGCEFVVPLDESEVTKVIESREAPKPIDRRREDQ
jgi:hypothetical protein